MLPHLCRVHFHRDEPGATARPGERDVRMRLHVKYPSRPSGLRPSGLRPPGSSSQPPVLRLPRATVDWDSPSNHTGTVKRRPPSTHRNSMGTSCSSEKSSPESPLSPLSPESPVSPEPARPQKPTSLSLRSSHLPTLRSNHRTIPKFIPVEKCGETPSPLDNKTPRSANANCSDSSPELNGNRQPSSSTWIPVYGSSPSPESVSKFAQPTLMVSASYSSLLKELQQLACTPGPKSAKVCIYFLFVIFREGIDFRGRQRNICVG